MQLLMVITAGRHGELITHLEPQRSRLGKTQVMRIRRLMSADKTRLRGNKPQMAFVTKPFGFGNGQSTFINAARG
jgi:hypothetical protein